MCTAWVFFVYFLIISKVLLIVIIAWNFHRINNGNTGVSFFLYFSLYLPEVILIVLNLFICLANQCAESALFTDLEATVGIYHLPSYGIRTVLLASHKDRIGRDLVSQKSQLSLFNLQETRSLCQQQLAHNSNSVVGTFRGTPCISNFR